MAELYIGLMSGTSLDAIDAVLVALDGNQVEVRQTLATPIPSALRRELLALCHGCDNEIERLGVADRQLGSLLAESALALCAAATVHPRQIKAIGSHGQTVRHRPPNAQAEPHRAFTLQVGDPNTIAEHSGITTVGDFRRRDIAAGGQGAPLVPAFHAALFRSSEKKRVILNIGGMANITALDTDGLVSGFDTGPGNVLMDAWIQRCHQLDFDRDGAWAESGRPVPELIDAFLGDPYFSQTGPKSTGRERFNLQALQDILGALPSQAPENVQQSLLQITAQSISHAVNGLPGVDEVYACGGGAYNTALLAALRSQIQGVNIETTAALGLAPEWVEAAAFAWLAQQTLGGAPGNVPSVTGASGWRVLGAVYPA